MIDSDVEAITYCGSREKAILKLGEKGARIWDWLRELEGKYCNKKEKPRRFYGEDK